MADLNASKYQRVFAVTVDSYGIDPIRDKLVFDLLNITSYQNHAVTQAERGAPDLLSYEYYGTEELWWVIMAYNRLILPREITQDKLLKIPDLSQVMSIVSDKTIDNQVVSRVVSL